MTDLQLILLALIQGATEWLPISSSAHLILLPELTGMPDQGPLIDAMAHLGSLGAVLLYFHRDIGRLARGKLDLVFGGEHDGARTRFTPNARLLLLIALATPPGVAAGAVYALGGYEDVLRNTTVIAWATIIFGVLLWVADQFASRAKASEDLRWGGALFIGLAQACAFVPGVSRSGVTMTAARALGLARDEAARFAMLLGIPLIAASGAYALLKLATAEHVGAVADDGSLIEVTLRDGLLVAGLSFLAAWASIWALMALIKRMSFLPFVLYRLALGGALLWLA